jgi:hypothetical protein
MRIDPAAARCFRLTFGVSMATFLAYAAALPLGYMLIVVTLSLLAAPIPAPGAKVAVVLVVVIVVTSLFGLLLGPVLTYVPVAGVLLSLCGVALAVVVSQRPGMTIIGTLMIMSSTIIAVIAAQSSAAAVAIVQVLVTAIIGAIVIAQLGHALFPEPPASDRPGPGAASGAVSSDVGWIALRSAIIMLPPLVAALSNPGSYIMLLMKGASLSQQADAGTTRGMARDMVTSTAAGGVAALLLWWLLSLWPGLLLLTLGMTLAILVMARPMYGAVTSRFRPDWWLFAMTNMIILIGPAVADTASADDIQRNMLVRLATFMGLALYAAAAVHLLDGRRGRRSLTPA